MPPVSLDQAIQIALEHHHAGRLVEAEKIYRRILAQLPEHADALRLLGVLAAQVGQHDSGAQLIRRAIAIQPDIAEYHLNLGIALHDGKKLDEAVAAYRQAIALDRDYFEAHVNLGNVLKERGELDAAIVEYQRAATLRPFIPEAHNNLGVALTDARRFDEALAALAQAIRLRSDYVEARYNYANALSEKGDLLVAIGAYRECLRLKSDHADAWTNLGITLGKLGRLDEAIIAHQQALQIKFDDPKILSSLASALSQAGKLDQSISAYLQALRLKPDFPDAHCNYGNVLSKLGRYDEAADAYRQALRLQPNYPQALNNLGHVLWKQDQTDAAIDTFHQVLRLDPKNREAHNGLGVSLAEKGDFAGAMASYQRALQIDPNWPEAHSHLGMLLLLLGDYETGLREYEWRRQTSEQNLRRRHLHQPMWDGQPLAGKTILLHSEQGFGDAIQFIRYAPLLAEHGGRVLLESPLALLRLMQNVEKVEQVVSATNLPAFDVQCPLMSLAHLLATRVQSIPRNTPYLHADQTLVQSWRKKLQPWGGTLRVGLVWAGNPMHPNDRRRSIAYSQIARLGQVKGVTFVSLQLPRSGAEPQPSDGSFELVDLTRELQDFADTAAVIENLDLVISVDTAVAHLAGALGKPLWVLLPFCPDWRWLLNRDDSPWYPTARLFRQSQGRDWAEVIGKVIEALCAWRDSARARMGTEKGLRL